MPADFSKVNLAARRVRTEMSNHMNAEALCTESHYILMPRYFPDSDDSIKGFVVRAFQQYAVVYNNRLKDPWQDIILWHEIGHIRLHHICDMPRNETALLSSSDIYELEANLFAAECMVSDDDLKEAMSVNANFYDVAQMLSVPIEFLDFKLRMYQWKHPKANLDIPVYTKATCLRY